MIEPAAAELYTGIADDKNIKPAPIGGTWYPDPYPSDAILPEGQHVILHLHGGSYILGDGRTTSNHYVPKKLLQNTPSSYVLCPQYRLASHKNGRFPAQLQDIIAAYTYLVHTLHIPASRIVLSGDSSGGHLVLALLRYIVELNNQTLLPTPKCSLVWSPWCDVPAAVDRQAWKDNPNYKTEYIPSSFPALGARQFLGDLKITEEVEKYLAPLHHPFAVPCPVLIITGAQEVLFYEHQQLARCFGEIAQEESPVELLVEENSPHDVLMIGGIMHLDREACGCAAKAGAFVSRIPSSAELARFDSFSLEDRPLK